MCKKNDNLIKDTKSKEYQIWYTTKAIHTSSAVPKPIKDDDDSYVDYFYDAPGALPGTLDLEPDAPAS